MSSVNENVEVYYTNYEAPMFAHFERGVLDCIPSKMIDKANKFVRWQDKQAYLLARILLLKGLEKFGFPADVLTKIQSNPFGKPYLEGPVFFNWSHSGKYVVCAFSKNSEVGIDVEQIRHIHFHDFKNIFTTSEYALLEKSAQPLEDFYGLWTRKESIIKGEGKGLSIPLNHVDVSKFDHTMYEGSLWHLKEIKFEPSYSCTLAMKERMEVTCTRFKL